MADQEKIAEALQAIAETNEPLSTVLAEILNSQEKMRKNQEEVVAYMITHILNGNGGTLDLTFIAQMLKGGN